MEHYSIELEELIKKRVIDFKDNYSAKLRNSHTKQIMLASSGDQKAKKYIKEFIRQELIKLNKIYKNKDISDPIITEIFANNWGLGILEKYDRDDVDELMIDGTRVSIEIRGQIVDLEERFSSEEESLKVIRRALEFDNSKDISKENPIIYAERKDGSRITASIPPISKAPYLNIRKFDSFLPTTENLLMSGTITKNMADLIELFVKGKANIAIIGEMGSGKTTFTKWALGFIPKGERVATLETTFELNPERLYPDLYFIQHRENEGLGIKLADTFRLTLRENVKRMLLGEMRSGEEVWQFLYACNRGHSGSIGTSHNMNAEGLLSDYADMVLEAGLSDNKEVMISRIATAVDIVIKFRKLDQGKRVCASIEEILKEGDSYKIIPLFKYEYDEENPTAEGQHIEVNKISSKLITKMNEYGMNKSEIERIVNAK